MVLKVSATAQFLMASSFFCGILVRFTRRFRLKSIVERVLKYQSQSVMFFAKSWNIFEFGKSVTKAGRKISLCSLQKSTVSRMVLSVSPGWPTMKLAMKSIPTFLAEISPWATAGFLAFLSIRSSSVWLPVSTPKRT